MLNPMFLQPNHTEKRKHRRAATQEFSTFNVEHCLDTANPRPSMGLFIGRLLIRMGQKLSKQDGELKGIRQNA